MQGKPDMLGLADMLRQFTVNRLYFNMEELFIVNIFNTKFTY